MFKVDNKDNKTTHASLFFNKVADLRLVPSSTYYNTFKLQRSYNNVYKMISLDQLISAGFTVNHITQRPV